jgi:hypothetical protein
MQNCFNLEWRIRDLYTLMTNEDFVTSDAIKISEFPPAEFCLYADFSKDMGIEPGCFGIRANNVYFASMKVRIVTWFEDNDYVAFGKETRKLLKTKYLIASILGVEDVFEGQYLPVGLTTGDLRWMLVDLVEGEDE